MNNLEHMKSINPTRNYGVDIPRIDEIKMVVLLMNKKGVASP